ncbi:MAG: GspE/PulE family protein [Eubacteriales bacterium]
MDNSNSFKKSRGKSSLGSMLVTMDVISREQLEEALEIQKKTYKKLGEILIKLGYCSEANIASAMSANYGYQMVSLNEIGIDITAASLITPEKAIKNHLLPVMKDDKYLYVAMQNPDDIIAIDDLQLMTGYTIKPIIVFDSELQAAINNYVNSTRNVVVNTADVEGDDSENIDTGDADDKPAVNFVNQMIDTAVKSNASDVHFEPQEKYLRVRYRIDGVLHEVMQQPLKMQASILSRIKVMGGMDIAERRIPQDGRATVRIENKIIDIRIAALPAVYGEKITMRLLMRNTHVVTMNELGFSKKNDEIIKAAVDLPYGFIIITGPTGSGKSTTLYALLSHLNKDDKNIITLEDPVERRIAGINQVQLNNRAGMTFSSGLRSILRSDPDIIMIGEVRDKETAKIAVESALTGHFVLSTLHTNNAAASITRLSEMGVDPFLISSSVIAVIAQRLVRVLCTKCKEPHVFKKHELRELIPDFPFDPDTTDDSDVTLYQPKSCISCNGTGYKGRRGVYEILKITPRIQNLILSGASEYDIKDTAVSEGMLSLRQDGLQKVKEGITSYEDMIRVVM